MGVSLPNVMNILKAIEELSDNSSPHELRFTSEYCEAIKLGIEALKRENNNRASSHVAMVWLLPGETEE